LSITGLYAGFAIRAFGYTHAVFGFSLFTIAAMSGGYAILIRSGRMGSPCIWIITGGIALTITANSLTTQIGGALCKYTRSKKQTREYD
jgi:hypothetical protein